MTRVWVRSKVTGVRVRSKLPGEFGSVPNYPKSSGPFQNAPDLGPFQNSPGFGPFQFSPNLGPFQNAPDLGPFQNAPDFGPFQKVLTCDEGEEVYAEDGEDLDLGPFHKC
jgi:hypothetical protein